MRFILRILIASMNLNETHLEEIYMISRGTKYENRFAEVRKQQRIARSKLRDILDDMIDDGTDT